MAFGGACLRAAQLARRRRPARGRARPRPRPARRVLVALRSLRESFSSCLSASSTSSWAFAVSSSARRASVSRSSWRSSAPRASAVRALGLGPPRAPRRPRSRPRRSRRRRPRPARRACQEARPARPRSAGPTPACAGGRRLSLGRIFPKDAAENHGRDSVVTIDARAPVPASRPDQARRLTRSLSVMAAESMRRGRRRWSARCGPWPARTPPRSPAAGRRSSR